MGNLAASYNEQTNKTMIEDYLKRIAEALEQGNKLSEQSLGIRETALSTASAVVSPKKEATEEASPEPAKPAAKKAAKKAAKEAPEPEPEPDAAADDGLDNSSDDGLGNDGLDDEPESYPPATAAEVKAAYRTIKDANRAKTLFDELKAKFGKDHLDKFSPEECGETLARFTKG